MNCFIDSNVWLYVFIEDQGEDKAEEAKTLIQESDPAVSTQIINEVCVNLTSQTDLTEEEIRELITSFHRRYPVFALTERAMSQASELRERYSFSFWDSMIVSSALEAGVKTLYSEDMQDGLKVEERLSIVNPFGESGDE